LDTDSPEERRSKVTLVVITGLCTIASVIWGTLYYLGDVDEKLSTRHFYGKVIERSEEIEHTHVVCFTSVPPEVDAYFQSHRQHAAKAATR
jgi:hypothetical protein